MIKLEKGKRVMVISPFYWEGAKFEAGYTGTIVVPMRNNRFDDSIGIEWDKRYYSGFHTLGDKISSHRGWWIAPKFQDCLRMCGRNEDKTMYELYYEILNGGN